MRRKDGIRGLHLLCIEYHGQNVVERVVQRKERRHAAIAAAVCLLLLIHRHGWDAAAIVVPQRWWFLQHKLLVIVLFVVVFRCFQALQEQSPLQGVNAATVKGQAHRPAFGGQLKRIFMGRCCCRAIHIVEGHRVGVHQAGQHQSTARGSSIILILIISVAKDAPLQTRGVQRRDRGVLGELERRVHRITATAAAIRTRVDGDALLRPADFPDRFNAATGIVRRQGMRGHQAVRDRPLLLGTTDDAAFVLFGVRFLR